jgi:hypothetical protein
MDIAVKVQDQDFAEAEVLTTVADTLKTGADLARLRREHYLAILRRFEDAYHFSSEEFQERFESGELGDDAEWFEWLAAKRGFDIWDRKYRILCGISL